MHCIEACGISQRYTDGGEELILFENLSFTAQKGSVSVIMGPSGSGKSSLLKQLSTIDILQSGTLRIAGKDIGSLNENHRARFRSKEIGFIFQSFALLEELTLLQNCMVPLQIQGLSRLEAESKAHDLLKRLLPDVDYKRYPYQLSGGEQQRAAIARALVHNPSIVIADEPTGNLDEDNSIKVRQLLQHIAKDLGKCVVIVTHEHEYESIADRLYRFHLSDIPGIKSELRKVRG